MMDYVEKNIKLNRFIIVHLYMLIITLKKKVDNILRQLKLERWIKIMGRKE